MRTNIEIDDGLMAEAMSVAGTSTKRDTVEEALRQMVRAKRQWDAFQSMKGIGWEGDLDDMRASKYASDTW